MALFSSPPLAPPATQATLPPHPVPHTTLPHPPEPLTTILSQPAPQDPPAPLASPAPQATPAPQAPSAPRTPPAPQAQPVTTAVSIVSEPRLQQTTKSLQPLPRKSWKSIFSDGHDLSRSRPIVKELVDGTAHISLPDDVLQDPTPLWSSFIVGHFLGKAAPHIGKVHATVNRLWQNQDKSLRIDAQFITSKSVLFKIENSQIRARVLTRHCWHISETPMLVQQWNPRAATEKPDLSSIPLWVDFRNVPDHLFTKKGLLCLGDSIGSAQRLHPNTERCTRLDVARVLVVVNLINELPTSICLNSEPGIKIAISYPWLPIRCSVCRGWGHTGKECVSKVQIVTNKSQSGRLEACKSPICPGKEQQEKAGSEQLVKAGKSLSPVKANDITEEFIAIAPEKNRDGNELSIIQASSGNGKQEVPEGNNQQVEEFPLTTKPSNMESGMENSVNETANNQEMKNDIGPKELTQEPVITEPERLWTLVTRGNKSPSSTRMMKGKRVDSHDSCPASQSGKDSCVQVTHVPNGKEVIADVEDDITVSQLIKEQPRSKRTTSKKETNNGGRNTNQKKSSTRKA